MSIAEQLARTVLLFQNDLGLSDPAIVLRALTAPTISLVADAEVASSRSGQVAITTAAMLIARSGHSVFVDAADAPLVGAQPPMEGASLHDALAEIGDKMIDGVQITIGCPLFPADIAFIFGGGVTGIGVRANRLVSVGWTDWSGEIKEWPLRPALVKGDWPIGAMATSTLVACEALKVSGLLLTKLSPHPEHFQELFAPCHEGRIKLAPDDTPKVTELDEFDVISGGAVSNAFLYALLRLPEVSGQGRVFDRDISEPGNRNRNVLLLPQFLRLPKVDLFKHFQSGLMIEPVPRHFIETDLSTLRQRVVVGVDDIRARWMLAGANVGWMGVGATSHFSAMASAHYSYAACVACLHPHDEMLEGDTPTVAPVSFLAGLMVAADFLRDIAGDIRLASHSRYITPLRPGGDWSGQVPPIPHCPAGCPASQIRAA